MQWRLIGRTLRIAFLLRVPVLMLIVLAGLGPLALQSSIVSNLFDQGNPSGALQNWYLFTVSFAAFILAFTAVTNINITLHYGNDRFEDGPSLGLAQKRPLLTFLVGCGAAVSLVVCVFIATKPVDPGNLVYLVLGYMAAFGLVLLAKVVQLAFTDPKTTPHPPPFLVFPAYKIKFAEHFFDNIYCWSSEGSRATKNWFNRLSQWPLGILQPAGQGYLINLDPPEGQPLRLKSGQVFAVSLSVIAFVTYLIIGLWKSQITAADNKIPALAFVLLFLIVACWGLSALTFFFDRYRFPLLWTVSAFSLITIISPQSDHFFRVVTLKDAMREPPNAVEYVKERLEIQRRKSPSKPQRLIVVTAPGGGIQAAAWTAEVLTKLNQNDVAPGFRDSVALISSVSGGSLGSMIYAASFTDKADKVDPVDVPMNARRSAIDEVAWGWTVPDLWRVMLPWFRTNRAIDRGWALERKWSAVNHLNDAENPKTGTTMGDWANRAWDGQMPALLINSMLVERGQPVVFSNTRFPAKRDKQERIANFYDLNSDDQYLHYDIRVNTAARLSASFSYVAPASRPDLDGIYAPGFHFVDGGYYDNYGMTSLLTWLGEALEDTSVRERWNDILVLQIRHFNEGTLPAGSRQGWGFQLLAPPFALYNMRDYAQESVARKQLELFAKVYSGQHVNIWKASIKYTGTNSGLYHCADQPLSWKLDQYQQKCIDLTWSDVVSDPKKNQRGDLQCVAAYVRGDAMTTQCQSAYGEE
jgi:hypothetical protein